MHASEGASNCLIACHTVSYVGIPSQLHLWTPYSVGFAPVYIVVDETSGVMIVY